MFKTSYFRMLCTCLVLLSLVMLNACTTTKRKDGPPNYYIDTSKIPNAVPKVEPKSKYGNPPTYSVFGKRYYVMNTNKNYEEVGTASWYGTSFHARRTSSGEPYDLAAMTAAHKSLPLPTYLEVTNLDNHHKIIVKVNDRGPFVGDRIIDLSYVAAKKLGMMGRGTAHVKIKAIDPVAYWNNIHLAERRERPTLKHSNTYDMAPKKASATSTYAMKHRSSKPTSIDSQSVYLQVGAFRNKQLANKLQHRLSNVVDEPVNVAQGSKKLYIVQIGPIKNSARAKKINAQLKQIGLKENTLLNTKVIS